MTSRIPWKGKAHKLKDSDFPRIGQKIGVGEDELHAVLDVECRGSGFDRSGRVVMLFEPHIFWRELADTPDLQREAQAAGLAYPRWGTRPYPPDSYPRLERALDIDREAGFRSASWGAGQILGRNHEAAGFDWAEDMVAAFADSQAAQLDAMVAFIKANGLDKALRDHNWPAFAKGYNGPAYAAHGYHTRLAARFAWWASKPDTPWTPDLIGCVCPDPMSDAQPAPDTRRASSALSGDNAAVAVDQRKE